MLGVGGCDLLSRSRETADGRDPDAQAPDTWPVTNSRDGIARRIFRVPLPALFSADSPELPLLHFLFHIRSGTGPETLIATTGGAQDTRVVGGTQQISAPGDAVRQGAVVQTVRQDDADVAVEFEGGSVTSRRVVVAVPQTPAGRLRYTPAPPALRDGLIRQVPAGSVTE
ncbi:FAD-dependent oxidoreductase [Embleya sp. NPDC050493]|uniref:FAD-dependent oxidoreductase n=1 Tax=Embleya sp. NPDC050493 TaxID=3363989 RepID=UPI003796F4D7